LSAPPEIIPAISGTARTGQTLQRSTLLANLHFVGEHEQFQQRQTTAGFGEVVDVELELLTAIMLEVA